MVVILLFLSLTSFDVNCDVMLSIRAMYHDIQNKQELELFIDQAQNLECAEVRPYLASAIMKKAEYCFWPHAKLKNFNTGKKMMEGFILDNPRNLEARYLRFIVQKKAPSFLGYNDEIQSDFEFIQSHIASSELPEDFKRIIWANIQNVLN